MSVEKAGLIEVKPKLPCKKYKATSADLLLT